MIRRGIRGLVAIIPFCLGMSAVGWAADLNPEYFPTYCDKNRLAMCLSKSADDFAICESDCRVKNPKDDAKYFDCRDDCRAEKELEGQVCLHKYCPPQRPTKPGHPEP